MALHLVTGYKGTPHITADDVGAFNAGIIGLGDYVLPTGNKLSASMTSSNTVKILDGDAVIQGRHISLKKDTYEELTINNGENGKNRNDLIVIRYTKDGATGSENATFAVIQGTSTDGTATDPEYTTGDILSGDCILHEMPLYRIPLTGLTVGEPEALFEVVKNPLGGLKGFIEYGDLPFSSSDEDIPSFWASIGSGIWNVQDGSLLQGGKSNLKGTLVNTFHNSASTIQQVVQILFTSGSGILLRRGASHTGWSKDPSDGKSTYDPWRTVKQNYINPVVTGTYSGDEEDSQFIELGFTPAAVMVFRSDGSTARTAWNGGYGSYFYGGLAVDPLGCNFWDGSSDFPIIKITGEVSGDKVLKGFRVYNTTVEAGSQSANGYIQTNAKSTYYYVAFRN